MDFPPPSSDGEILYNASSIESPPAAEQTTSVWDSNSAECACFESVRAFSRNGPSMSVPGELREQNGG